MKFSLIAFYLNLFMPIVEAQNCSEVSTEGYLIDNFCWDLPDHIAIDGANLFNSPQTHSRHCMFDIPQCIENGYGIIVNQGNGTYAYKYAFDDDDNIRVLSYLENTAKTDDFLVTVDGTYCSDTDTFSLKTLSDSNGVGIKALDDDSDCKEVTTEGYLIDNFCWDLPDHIAIDGADLLNEPKNHSRHCMFDIPQCIENGYGIVVKQDNGTYAYKYGFNEEDNLRVIEYLKNTPKESDFLVTVKGNYCSETDVFDLLTLSDSNGVGIEALQTQPPAEEAPSNSDNTKSGGYHLGHYLSLVIGYLCLTYNLI